jgi:hypothetical protein
MLARGEESEYGDEEELEESVEENSNYYDDHDHDSEYGNEGD